MVDKYEYYTDEDWEKEFEDLPENMKFINYYKCTCGQEWVDVWSSMCDDRCPKCETSISPHKSEDIK